MLFTSLFHVHVEHTHTAYSLHFSTGAVIAWPSPVIPRLRLTSSQDSLIGSLFSLGAAPGPVIAALCLERFGRRGTLQVVSCFFIASWLLLLSWDGEGLASLYTARLLGGAGVGGAFAGVSVYVAEIADEKSRGPLGSLLQTFMAVGLLVEYCVGPYVGFRSLAWVSLSVTLASVLAFSLACPESPHYLLAKGRLVEAKISLRTLRGSSLPQGEIDKEIAQIQKSVLTEYNEDSALTKLLSSTSVHRALGITIFLVMVQQGSGINAIHAYLEYIFQLASIQLQPESSLITEKNEDSPLKKLLRSNSVHRALGITIFLVMMQQGSGINGVLAYIEYIFQLTSLQLQPEVVPILVGLTNLFASLPAPFLVKKFGNKAVFLLSCIGSGVCLCLVGVYFYLLDYNYDVSQLGFLPVASVLLFNIFFCVGLGPLVWSTAAELFAPGVKGTGMALGGIFSALYGFLVIELFSEALHVWGALTVFFGFGGYLLLGGLAMFFIVPSTSQMSLQEIQNYLKSFGRTTK